MESFSPFPPPIYIKINICMDVLFRSTRRGPSLFCRVFSQEIQKIFFNQGFSKIQSFLKNWIKSPRFIKFFSPNIPKIIICNPKKIFLYNNHFLYYFLFCLPINATNSLKHAFLDILAMPLLCQFPRMQFLGHKHGPSLQLEQYPH